MPLHVHYGHNATPSGPGFDINLGSVIQMGFAQNGIFQAPDSFTGLINEAQVGGSAVSSVILDDVDGTLGHNGDAITGLNRMYFIETSCPSGDQRVWNGYIGAREYMRGEESGITPIGAARRILVELADDNAILHFRVAYASDADRPAERAGQRLAWLLGSDYLATVHDNGFVAYPCNPMDKADYRGQYASDVLADISKITGDNYFTYFDEANANIGLWFEDSNTSTDYTSAIMLSNFPADLAAGSNSIRPVHEDAKLRRDPSRVAYGVYLPFTGGTYYGTLGPTGAQFGPRDQVAPSAMVKTLSIASNLATRYLNDNSTEDDRVTCTVTLPASDLTAIKVGQRMQVRFSHLPGWNGDWVWARVVRRTIARTTPSNDFYDMILELSPQKKQCPNPTPAGFYPALLGTAGGGTFTDGVTAYSHPGGTWVSPNGWTFFPVYNATVFGQQMDVGHTGVLNSIIVRVTGDGTMTIHAYDDLVGDQPYLAITDNSTGQFLGNFSVYNHAPGQEISISLSGSVSGVCLHELNMQFGDLNLGHGSIAYAGFDWTPA